MKALLIAALAGCGSSAPTGPEPAPEGAVTVLYTSRGEGEIEPCG